MKTNIPALLILDALVLLGSIATLIPTAMIFDDGNTKDKGRWFVFWTWMALPAVALAGLGAGWWFWKQGNNELALKFVLAPIVWAAVGVAALLKFLK
jgi:cytochrome bd-type quinol oxidase subunit 2